jgi:tetratricopeptide (TPR) repeat protein
VADCNESLRLLPGDGEALGYRGLAYLKMKRLDLALADYDAALQANPKNAFSLYGRGVAKRLNGHQAGANSDIAAAEQINPDIAADFERYGVRAR